MANDTEKKTRSFIEMLFEKLKVAPGSLESATLSRATQEIQDAIQKRTKKSGQ